MRRIFSGASQPRPGLAIHPEAMITRPLLFSLLAGAAACAASPPATCPQEQPAELAASAPSAWVEVSAPRDISLLQAPARVVLAGDRQAVIRPLFRAQIARFHVRAGDRVRAGQPVVDVVMPEVVTAAATYRGAVLRSTTQHARRDKLRAMRGAGLVAEGAVFDVATLAAESEQQALTALATLRAAGIDPAGARDLLRDPNITLTSATDGVVRELQGSLGEVVEGQGPPIARIVGEGAPRIEVRFLHAPPAGSRMRFLGVDGSVWPLTREPLARTVEADDGAVIMWFAVDTDQPAAPGLRGTVEVSSDDPRVVQVPVGALGRRGTQPVVYRRRDAAVRPVPVELLAASGASALVRATGDDPLVPGDRVADDARPHARETQH